MTTTPVPQLGCKAIGCSDPTHLVHVSQDRCRYCQHVMADGEPCLRCWPAELDRLRVVREAAVTAEKALREWSVASGPRSSIEAALLLAWDELSHALNPGAKP